MQFFRFKPERAGLWFQFRHSSNDHPKKMLGFACFLPASSDALQKFLFGNCIIGFDVIGSDAASSAHQLTDDAIRDRVSWNRLCEIDDTSPNRAVRSSRS